MARGKHLFKNELTLDTNKSASKVCKISYTEPVVPPNLSSMVDTVKSQVSYCLGEYGNDSKIFVVKNPIARLLRGLSLVELIQEVLGLISMVYSSIFYDNSQVFKFHKNNCEFISSQESRERQRGHKYFEQVILTKRPLPHLF